MPIENIKTYKLMIDMAVPVNIAGLILSAGLSSRMQGFKPLLAFGEQTIIEHAIETLRTAGIRDILVVVGYGAERLIPILGKHAVGWVLNSRFRQEMFTSIRIGVAHLKKDLDAFFLLPVDTPFVRPSTLKKMMAIFQSNRTDLVRPCYRGRHGHPPLIPASMIPSILSFKNTGGLRALLSESDIRKYHLECDDPGVLIDLNTREDYEKAMNRDLTDGVPISHDRN